MSKKVDKEIEIQFLLAQQIVELKSELKEERKMCNFYIEYSKKLEAKLKEAEDRNKDYSTKLCESCAGNTWYDYHNGYYICHDCKETS